MGNEKEKNNDFQFEIVNDNEMQFANRGRKSNISNEQLEIFRNQIMKSVGKFFVVGSMTMPKEITEKKDQSNYKASVSATLRLIAKKLDYKVNIRWTVKNCPAVKFTKK